MNGFYLLASYPKSGNTWVRALLRNYWFDDNEPSNINSLHIRVINTRVLFDETLHIDSSDLLSDELDALRPTFYREFAKTVSHTNHVFKVHDAFQRLENGDPFFPEDVALGVIYVIRNPLDVAVSYAHHSQASIDEVIESMAEENFCLVCEGEAQFPQLPQRLYSWSSHVRSWVDEAPFPLHLVRYEDLFFKPLETFSGVLQFIDEALVAERIEKAIRFSSFAELKKQETEQGFREKPLEAQSFFRKGVVGDWRETLTPAQIKRVIADHHEMMRRFGYLADDDEPLVGAPLTLKVPPDKRESHSP